MLSRYLLTAQSINMCLLVSGLLSVREIINGNIKKYKARWVGRGFQ